MKKELEEKRFDKMKKGDWQSLVLKICLLPAILMLDLARAMSKFCKKASMKASEKASIIGTVLGLEFRRFGVLALFKGLILGLEIGLDSGKNFRKRFFKFLSYRACIARLSDAGSRLWEGAAAIKGVAAVKSVALVILMISLILITAGTVAAATVSHPASQITNNTFGIGDFAFPNNLNITANLTINRSVLFVDSNLGRVGIGTTSPGAKLDVRGGTQDEIAGFFGSGQTAGDEHLLRIGNDQGFSHYGVMLGSVVTVSTPSAQDHAFIVKTNDGTGDAHTERLRITSGGNVGIGTTSPTQKLEVNGTLLVNLSDSVGSNNIGLFANGTHVGINTSTPLQTLNVVGDLNVTGTSYFGAQSFTNIDATGNLVVGKNLTVGSTNLFVDNNTGRVGIGTTGPGAKLDIVRDGSEVLQLRDSTSYAIGVGGGVSFMGKYKADGTYFQFGQIFGVKENANVNDASGSLIFKTYRTGDGGVLGERMRITSGGNVGIGTTVPTQKLEVNGTLLVNLSDSVGSNNIGLFANGTHVGINTSKPLQTLNVVGDLNVTGTSYFGAQSFTNIDASGNLNISGNLTVDIDALFVDSNTDRVGIETNTPSATLEVNGNVSINENLTLRGDLDLNGTITKLPATAISNDGLVLYLPLDGDTKDYSGNNNHGTNEGSNFTTNGKIGGANVFDGIDDYLKINDSATLSPTEAISIEFWMNPNGLSENFARIVFKAFSYDIQSMGPELRFSISSDAGSDFVDSNTQFTNYGTWYHVVGTYDRQNMKIYVNGQLDISAVNTSAIRVYSDLVNVGGDANYNFNGTLDEVRIYNRTLSAKEIKQHYNAKVTLLEGDAYVRKAGDVIYGDLNIINGSGDPKFYINTTSGYVGIGHLHPVATLEINTTNEAGALHIINTTTAKSMFFVNGTTGHIGIGTITPLQTLNIVGDLNVTGTSYLADITISADNITTNGIISKDGNISFYNSTGNENVRITESGNVGIGTTAPTQKLEVNGTLLVNLSNSVGSNNIGLFANGTHVGINTSSPLQTLNIVGDLNVTGTSYFGSQSFTNIDATGNLNISGNLTVDINTLFVDSNVGRIGINTTSPSKTLDVAGTLTFSPATDIVDILGSSSQELDISAGSGQILDLQDSNAADVRLFVNAGSGSKSSLVIYDYAASSNNKLSLSHDGIDALIENSNVTGDIILMPGTNSGNVGIGTTAPTQKLEVNGTLLVNLSNGVGSNNIGLFANGTHVGINTSKPLQTLNVVGDLNVTGTSYLSDITITSDNITVNNIVSKDGNITFNNNTNAEMMRITNDGNVGIGTTNPTTKLEFAAGTTAADGIEFGDDVTLYRSAANVLKTDDDFQASRIALSSASPFISFDTVINNAEAISLGAGAFYWDLGSANQLSVRSYGGATQYFNVLSGKVGINASPKQTLEVIGTINFTNNTGGLGLFQNDYGNIGIGTISPLQELVVVGDLNVTGTSYFGSQSFTNIDATGNLVIGKNLTVNNSDLFVDSNLGRVGIGTASPDYKLEVNGTLGSGDIIYSQASGDFNIYGGSSQASLRLDTANSTGSQITRLKIGGGDNPNAYFDNIGNVGIGTATPFLNFASATGDFGGNDEGVHIAKPDASKAAWLLIEGAERAGIMIADRGAGVNDKIFNIHTEAGITYFAVRNDDLTWLDQNVMTIDHSTGNVGIGTSNPLYKLSVANTSNAVNLSSVLFIDGNTGRVGIGTTVPNSKLTVNGSLNVINTSDASSYFYVNSTSGYVGIGTTSPGVKLDVVGGTIRVANSANTLAIVNEGTTNWVMGVNPWSVGNDVFSIGLNQAGGSKLVINSTSGNVGIGTASPANLLHVSGSGGSSQIILKDSGANSNTSINISNDAREWFIGVQGAVSDRLAIRDITANTNPFVIQASAPNNAMTIQSDGDVDFSAGNVGIGNTTPNNILAFEIGSATDPIADNWATYSTKDSKEIIGIADDEAMNYLEKFKELKVYKFKKIPAKSLLESNVTSVPLLTHATNESSNLVESKSSSDITQHPKFNTERLGILVEEAPAEILSYNEEGNPVGIALYSYIGFLHEVMKAQQSLLEKAFRENELQQQQIDAINEQLSISQVTALTPLINLTNKTAKLTINETINLTEENISEEINLTTQTENQTEDKEPSLPYQPPEPSSNQTNESTGEVTLTQEQVTALLNRIDELEQRLAQLEEASLEKNLQEESNPTEPVNQTNESSENVTESFSSEENLGKEQEPTEEPSTESNQEINDTVNTTLPVSQPSPTLLTGPNQNNESSTDTDEENTSSGFYNIVNEMSASTLINYITSSGFINYITLFLLI